MKPLLKTFRLTFCVFAIVLVLGFLFLGVFSLLKNENYQLLAAPTHGLMGLWRLDETSGNSAVDSSGNGNSGVVTNLQSWNADGKINGSLNFTGGNSYLTLPDNASLSPGSGGFSVSEWVRFNSLSGDQTLWSDYGTGYLSQLIIQVNAANSRISVSVRDDATNFVSAASPTNLSTGIWYHVTVVRSGGTISLYLNGQMNANGSNSLLGNVNLVGNNYGPRLGNNIWGGSGLNGSLDDVRVYNRALSSQEVLDIYNETGASPLPTPTATPVPTVTPILTPTPTQTPVPTPNLTPTPIPTISNVTTINISGNVNVAGVTRFGLNLQGQTFYDSGLMAKNLVYRNPGFEGGIFRSVIRCVSGTATTCIDDNNWSVWPNNFWNGATYNFIYGSAKGRSGIISSFGSHTNGGNSFNFNNSGTVPAAGDVMVVSLNQPGGADLGWWMQTSGAGSYATEYSDLYPNTEGKQAMRAQAPSANDSVSITSYLDSMPGKSFVRINGSYRLTFKAKRVSGTGNLRVSFGRSGYGSLLNRDVALTSNWAPYDITFSAAESGSEVGTLALAFVVSNQTMLLDDVSLEQIGNPTNNTIFRDEVVNTIKEYNPGILRNWTGQLTDTIDNQIAPTYGRLRSGYAVGAQNYDAINYSLQDFLELCEKVGADPWYVVPVSTTPQEMQNLLEFLGGPTTTVYGAKRSQLGHSTPWTQVFNKIHLEFGNESWNSTFSGGIIPYSDAYGTRGSEIFGVAKASPYYNSSKYNLILDGQFVWVGRNVDIQNHSTNNDSLSVGPYFGTVLNNYANNEQIFGPMLGEAEWNSSSAGFMGQNVSRVGKPIVIYENNIGTLSGSAPQNVMDSFVPSEGAGLGLANSHLIYLRDNHVLYQNVWSLPQYSFNISNPTRSIKMWGVVVDMGKTNLKRPQFYAMKLANMAVSGDMLATSQSGDNPTWSVNNLNDLTFNNAHYIQSYAFKNGSNYSLLLVNLHRSNALSVNFAGQNVPAGNVTMTRYGSVNITDNNESSQNVGLTSPIVLSNFNSNQSYSLPPYSMTLLTWSGGSGGGSPNPTPMLGDLNVDHIVNSIDYSLLNSRWLQNYSAYDLLVDSIINSFDYAILKNNWGKVW